LSKPTEDDTDLKKRDKNDIVYDKENVSFRDKSKDDI
jgi:hypothetical protein